VQRIRVYTMFITGLFAMIGGVAGIAVPVAAQEDYSRVRGANFIPTYASNDLEIWKNFDPEVIDRELGYAESMGLNSVRIFLQYHVYEHDPKTFIDNVAKFVDLCEKHGIRPMLTVFDGCMGVSPSMNSTEFWVASPGWDRANARFYTKGEAYVKDLVDRFKGDDRILFWDVMNEPTVSPQGITPEGKREIWDFVRHFAKYFKEVGATQPLTAGVVGGESSEIIDVIDVLSLHTYANTEEILRQNIAEVRKHAQAAGKPFIITEVGAPAWGCEYEMIMPVLKDERVGSYVWEVMIGKTMFSRIAGLFYSDGTVRRRSSVEAVMGREAPDLVEKPDAEGIPLGNAVTWQTMFTNMFARMVKSPTDDENWHERYTALFNASHPVILKFFGDRCVELHMEVAKAKGMYDAMFHKEAFAELDKLLVEANKIMSGEEAK
jgi:hypothetical protein